MLADISDVCKSNSGSVPGGSGKSARTKWLHDKRLMKARSDLLEVPQFLPPVRSQVNNEDRLVLASCISNSTSL